MAPGERIERERLWRLFERTLPALADYGCCTDRELPVMVMEPISA